MPLPPTPTDILNRAQGCLLGLAVGDTLGAPLEFSTRGTLPSIIDLQGDSPFMLCPDEWTNGMSMALALADSVLVQCQFEPGDRMTRFVAWRKEGAFSCTGTCFDGPGIVYGFDQGKSVAARQADHSATTQT
jgi:ADP-ribosyl-[dinitrogen reductase] hydrolase